MQGQRYMQDQMSNDVISLHFSIFDCENLKITGKNNSGL